MWNAQQDFNQGAQYNQQAQNSHVLRDGLEGGGAGLVFGEGEKLFDRFEGRPTNGVHVGRDMLYGAGGGAAFGEGQKLYDEHEANRYNQMGDQSLMQGGGFQQQGGWGGQQGGMPQGGFQQQGGFPQQGFQQGGFQQQQGGGSWLQREERRFGL